MKKNIIFLLSIFLILTQSCVLYNNTSVTLSQALYQGKVKVTDKSGQEYKFDNIVIIDSVYHGMGLEYISETQYVRHEGAKTALDSANISSILIKDIRKSSNRTVLLVLGIIPAAYIAVGATFILFYAFN